MPAKVLYVRSSFWRRPPIMIGYPEWLWLRMGAYFAAFSTQKKKGWESFLRASSTSIPLCVICRSLMRTSAKLFFVLHWKPCSKGVACSACVYCFRPGGAEMAGTQGIPSAIPVDLCYAPAQNHSQLMLPNHYETFLESLGHQTRRNFRYYRRRSEAANVQFIDKLSIEEFASAASTLQSETLIKSGSKAIKRAIEMISATERPLLVGLRHRDGEWLSILGGWYESDRAVIFLQMNSDRRHRNASLSIVLRGYLLEWFILRGVKKVVFWAGSGGQLSRYAEYIPSIAVHLDKQSFLWKAVRHLVAPLISLLPGPVANLAQWIVPRTHQQNFDSDVGS